MTDDDLALLLGRFLDRTLPAAEWTHHAHLQVGLMLARRLPQDQLLPTLRETIGAYNIASGGRNTDEAGYHETITAFYAAALGAFARATLDLPPAEAARRLLAGPIADRGIVLNAYDEQTLKSKAARLGYCPPDHAGFSPDALAADCLADAG
jgi:hypothetical protein